MSEVSEVSADRHEAPAGLVVGISAISASDTPIADSSPRRPGRGAREYFRTGGPAKRVSDLCALSAPHWAALDQPTAVRVRRAGSGRSRCAHWGVDADEHLADLSRRRSAGISHNIAQERQADSASPWRRGIFSRRIGALRLTCRQCMQSPDADDAINRYKAG